MGDNPFRYIEPEDAADARHTPPLNPDYPHPAGHVPPSADGHFTHDGVPMRAAIYAAPEFARTREAIKEALRGLLMVDVVNDEDDELVAKLRTVADGLIEAL